MIGSDVENMHCSRLSQTCDVGAQDGAPQGEVVTAMKSALTQRPLRGLLAELALRLGQAEEWPPSAKGVSS